MLVGQGAGALPTGTAVVSDIIEAGRNLASHVVGRVPHMGWFGGVRSAPLAGPRSRKGAWYLRFLVADTPGVLAQIAGALGARGISIASVLQREQAKGAEAVSVIVMTHDAREVDVREAVASLDGQPFSHGATRIFAHDREAW